MLALDPTIAAEPRTVLPNVNVTVPAGEPLAAQTVAVSTLLPAVVIADGAPASDKFVAAGGGTTVTVALLVELAKLPAAVKFAVIVLLPTVRLLAFTVILTPLAE